MPCGDPPNLGIAQENIVDFLRGLLPVASLDCDWEAACQPGRDLRSMVQPCMDGEWAVL